MTDLRKAAQAVIDDFEFMRSAIDEKLWKSIEALRQALAAPVEPDAWLHQVADGDGEPDMALSFAEDSFPFDGVCGYRSLSRRPLYTTPPSVDALIAEVIKKHDERNVVIKTVNMRTNAQPYLDALIADLMELHLTWEDYQDVKEVCDKYRGVK